jgi:hypothetical protein
MTTPTAIVESGSERVFVSRSNVAVSRAVSTVSSEDGDESCSIWCGRKVKSCFLCCFSPCISLCSCQSKIAPEPQSPRAQFRRTFSALDMSREDYRTQVEQLVQTFLKENPSQLAVSGIGILQRADEVQVHSLDLSGVDLCDSTSGAVVAISRAAKIANLGTTFPNLTHLNLANTGIGQPERNKTFQDVQKGQHVHIDTAADCLKSIADNCSQLVKLNLSRNPITDAALMNLKSLKNLTSLSLQSCRKITPDGFAKLMTELPNLQVHFAPPKSARRQKESNPSQDLPSVDTLSLEEKKR